MGVLCQNDLKLEIFKNLAQALDCIIASLRDTDNQMTFAKLNVRQVSNSVNDRS